MAYAHYGMTWTQDDLEKVGQNIINKAKESESENEKQAHMVRLMYVEKIKRLKQKVLSEFDKTDKIAYGEVELLGDEQDPTKDVLMIGFLIEDSSEHKKIFKVILEFITEALRRTELDKFFIPKNFGVQDPKQDKKIELLFLKQNHSYKRIKEKPFIEPQDGEEEELGGIGGGQRPPGEFEGGPPLEQPPTEPEPQPEPEGGGDEG